MHNYLVDLHIHSCYSDGTMTPSEILKIASQNNVNIISITDHNVIEGAFELFEMCDKCNDICCISGVELDSLYNGTNFHVLGYGFDFFDTNFVKFVNDNNRLLEEVNIKLIGKIEIDDNRVSLDDYNKYKYNRKKGGWKALHYLVDRGLANNVWESFNFYEEYKHSYNCVKFPSINEVCRQIHNAGGKAVLAHPGYTIKYNSVNDFRRKLNELIYSNSLDGIECFYPKHTDEIRDICLNICQKNNLIITCGSDCHGDFEKTEIGELKIGLDKLNINALL